MNINQVRYFEAALEEGSFSAAARAQFVTVQAVSKAIADLERELGQPLFIRENRCVRPTEFGLAFHVKALPVLAAFENLETFAETYGEDEDPRPMRMLLCAPPFPNSEVVVPNIAALLGKAVGIEVTMGLSNSQDGVAALLSEQVDAIITIGKCEHRGIECVPVGTMQTGIAVLESHPLTKKAAVSIEDLNPYTVLLASEFDDFAQSIMSIYRECGLESECVKVSTKDAEFELGRFMEEGGYVFCANIPPLFKDMDDLAMVPIDQEHVEPVPICICTLKGKNVPQYKALVRMASSPAVLMSIM